MACGAQNFFANAIGTGKTLFSRRRRKWQVKLEKVLVFDWYLGNYRHEILVWPIAALRNELSANQKGVFSVTCNAETGFKVWGSRLEVWGYKFWAFKKFWVPGIEIWVSKVWGKICKMPFDFVWGKHRRGDKILHETDAGQTTSWNLMNYKPSLIATISTS